MPRKYTDEQLIEAVAASTTISAVVRALQLKAGGGTSGSVKRRIAQLGLDTSHFMGLGWSKGSSKRPDEVKRDLEPHLRRGRQLKGPDLRRRLVAAGLKEDRCERCGITEWQGEPAPLQIDHIDGDHFNNELQNLMILCANCHALTPTWCGRNKGKRKEGNE